MIKKMMLLAMAAAAVLAFAIPAAAQAEPGGMFYNEGNAITEPIEESLTGPISFTTTAGGFECVVHVRGTVETEGGTLDELELTLTTCVGSGALEGCSLLSYELTGTPTLTPTSANNDFDIEGFEFDSLSDCLGRVKFTAPTLTAVPNNPSAISVVDVSGETEVDFLDLGFSLPLEAHGELEAYVPETIGVTP